MKILEIEDITVKIRDKTLLDGISFSIHKGETAALLGHNGAGKSTLMKTIMGVMEKQKGTIKVMEQHDQNDALMSFKKELAYIPEEPMLLSELTVMQHFQLYGKSYNIDEIQLQERVDYYVRHFELTGRLSAYPEELSKGMRQKVQTICALLPNISLLLIDEPFMGLDIYAVEFLVSELKKKTSKGTSILLTTHQLEQAKVFADTFILLEKGMIVEKGPIRDFDSITRGTAAHD